MTMVRDGMHHRAVLRAHARGASLSARIAIAFSVWLLAVASTTVASADAPTRAASAEAPPSIDPPNLDGVQELRSDVSATGSFTTSVPFAVPPFHGLQPKLALAYDSTASNSPFGVGWNLTSPSVIQRMSAGKGVPDYNDNDIYLLDGFQLYRCVEDLPPNVRSPGCENPAGGGGQLVYYFTRREGYLRIGRDLQYRYWSVWHEDGTRANYATPWLTADGTHPYRWLLTSVVDTSGNAAAYEYDTCNPPGAVFVPQQPGTAELFNAETSPSATMPGGQVYCATHSDPACLTTAVLVDTSSNTSSSGIGASCMSGAFVNGACVDVTLGSTDAASTVASTGGSRARTVNAETWSAPGALAQVPQLWSSASSLSLVPGLSNQRVTTATSLPPGGPADYWYLKRVRYGRSLVELSWSWRQDNFTFGIGHGTQGNIGCVLNSVDVQTADEQNQLQRVRAYQLSYEWRKDSLRSALKSLQEFGSDAQLLNDGTVANPNATSALPPVKLGHAPAQHVGAPVPQPNTDMGFGLGPMTPGWVSTGDTNVSAAHSDAQGKNPSYLNLQGDPYGGPYGYGGTLLHADLNGDGLEDTVRAYLTHGSSDGYEVWITPFFANTGGAYTQLPDEFTGIVLHRVTAPEQLKKLGLCDSGDEFFYGGDACDGHLIDLVEPIIGDINGDGKQDIVWSVGHLSNEISAFEYTHWEYAVTFVGSLGIETTPVCDRLGWPLLGNPFMNARGLLLPDASYVVHFQNFATDVNGDGMADLVYVAPFTGLPARGQYSWDVFTKSWTVFVALSNGDGTWTPQPPIQTGLPLTWGTSPFVGIHGTRPAVYGDRWVAGDFNGDGKSDLVYISAQQPNTTLCLLSSYTSVASQLSARPWDKACQDFGAMDRDAQESWLVGDANADGRSDLFHLNPWLAPQVDEFTEVEVLTSTRSGFKRGNPKKSNVIWPIAHNIKTQRVVVINLPGAVGGTSQWSVMDYNGDGRADVGTFLGDSNSFSSLAGGKCRASNVTSAVLQSAPVDGDDSVTSVVRMGAPLYSDCGDAHALAYAVPSYTDYNGDGIADVEIRYLSNDRMNFRVDMGQKQFDEGTRVWRDADVSGDGLADLVRVSIRNPTNVNNGGGEYNGTGTDLYVSTAIRSPRGVLASPTTWHGTWDGIEARNADFFAGDVNADGRADLVHVRHAPPKLARGQFLRDLPDEERAGTLEFLTLISNGDGTWQEITSHLPLNGFAMQERANWLLADVDADGKADMVHIGRVLGGHCPSPQQLRIDTFFARGDGTWRPAAALAFADACDIPGRSTALRAADINGDGRADLVGVWSNLNGDLFEYTFLSQGDGQWTGVEAKYPGADAALGPGDWRATDVNGDHLTDLLAVGEREGQAGQYDIWALRLRSYGDGNGMLDSRVAIAAFDSADTRAWTVADFNGDGSADLNHRTFLHWATPVRVDTLIARGVCQRV